MADNHMPPAGYGTAYGPVQVYDLNTGHPWPAAIPVYRCAVEWCHYDGTLATLNGWLLCPMHYHHSMSYPPLPNLRFIPSGTEQAFNIHTPVLDLGMTMAAPPAPPNPPPHPLAVSPNSRPHLPAVSPSVHNGANAPTPVLQGCSSISMPFVESDGSQWLARVHDPESPDADVIKWKHQVELLSQKMAHLVAPNVVPDCKAGPRDYGVEMILTKCAPGTALDKLQAAVGTTAADASKVVQAVAELYTKLSDKEFSGVGSLLPSKSESGCKVGRMVGMPSKYPSPAAHLIERIDQRLEEIALAPAGTKDRFISFFALLEAKELVQKCKEMNAPGPTFLKHANLDVSSIVISETGAMVVHWEGAYATSFAEAFAAPPAFLHSETYHRSNELTKLERALIAALNNRSAQVLANAILHGRVYHRIHDAIKRTRAPSFEEICLLREAFLGPDDRPTSLDDWLAESIASFAGSPEVGALVPAMADKAGASEAEPSRGGLVYLSTLAREVNAFCNEVKEVAGSPATLFMTELMFILKEAQKVLAKAVIGQLSMTAR